MYRDQPFWVLFEAAMAAHYGEHPLGHRVLGTPETVGAMTREQMRGYFEGRYSADNTVLALAGRLDFPRVVERAGALCAAWGRTGATRDGARPPVPGGDLTLRDAKVTRGYFLALAPGPGVADDRRYAAALLSQVLGANDNSRLHWALVEPGLAEEASAGFDAHEGVGEYYVFASGDPERLPEIEGVVRREIATLADSVSADDLERLRNRLLTAATIGGERPLDRMHRLGRLWSHGLPHRPIEAELERINAVTLDEVRGVARDFPITPVTVGRMLPAEGERGAEVGADAA